MDTYLPAVWLLQYSARFFRGSGRLIKRKYLDFSPEMQRKADAQKYGAGCLVN